MAMRIDTVIEYVQFTKTKYIYKLKKKLSNYPVSKHDIGYGRQDYIITDYMIENERYLSVEELIITCKYNPCGLSEFSYIVLLNDVEVDEGKLLNIYEMPEDRKFQMALVYDNDYIGFYELLEVQEELINHHILKSVGKSYQIRICDDEKG